jgi:hypothetical protein
MQSWKVVEVRTFAVQLQIVCADISQIFLFSLRSKTKWNSFCLQSKQNETKSILLRTVSLVPTRTQSNVERKVFVSPKKKVNYFLPTQRRRKTVQVQRFSTGQPDKDSRNKEWLPVRTWRGLYVTPVAMGPLLDRPHGLMGPPWPNSREKTRQPWQYTTQRYR